MKIAALVPASRMFPGADSGFLAGLRGALAEDAVAHEIVVEPIGNGAVHDFVVDKIQRVLLQHAPDVVTGIMGAGLLRHVHTFFSDAETPFIVNDAGADPLMTGGVRNPWLFSNALNLWQSMYALGYWASRNLGPRAAVAAALHEAGYGIIHAFQLGMQAGGGVLIATEVTHRNSADEDPSASLERLDALGPDFVMGFYAGREGITFVDAWSALGLGERLPLLATPLMAHGHWRPRMGTRAAGVRTAFSWDGDAHLEELARFRRACVVRPDAEPAIFALLGYETGRMLSEARAALGRPDLTRDHLRAALSDVTFTSPRGTMRLDPATGEVATADYLIELRPRGDGALAPHTVEALPLPASFAADYRNVSRSDSRSGWINPYLIT